MMLRFASVFGVCAALIACAACSGSGGGAADAAGGDGEPGSCGAGSGGDGSAGNSGDGGSCGLDGLGGFRDAVADDAEDDELDVGSGGVPHGNPDTGRSSGPFDGGPVAVDLDLDGLDDLFEDRVIFEYLPFRSLHVDDDCPLSAIIFRLRPHPDAPTNRLFAVVDVLYERDCGASGHVGDNEVFGMTIDPALPAPAGILAIRAIAHQNTPCESITTCADNCRGEAITSCAHAVRRGANYPVVFYSKDKHGSYLDERACDAACFITNFCELAQAPAEIPIFNAGEPDAPLTRDLTAAGVITSTAGWTEQELFGFDPWGAADFGGAGNVAEDLVDDAFLTPACPL